MVRNYFSLILFLHLFISGTISAQTTVIPDAAFEQALIALGIDSDGVINGSVATDDVTGVTSLNVSFHESNPLPGLNGNISDLTGIEDFVSLNFLSCFNNQITFLNLSQNTNLIHLECAQNNITSLDVSNNMNLEELWCSENQLTSLNLTENKNLEQLYCSKNQLTSLDISQNTNLQLLQSAYNPITNLNLSQNIYLEELWCTENQLTNLDLSKNLNLMHLNCDDNEFIQLDVSKNTKLEYLYVNDTPITNLDVSKNTALVSLVCNNNQITSLNLSNNLNLEILTFRYNQLTSLNVKNGNNSIIRWFHAYGNPLLRCIQVDDEDAANAGEAPYTTWEKDAVASYSEDCYQSKTLIPDANFEQALLELNIDTDGLLNGYVFTRDIFGLTSLDVSNMDIADLTGIQDFISLTNLSCSYNELISLNLNQNRNFEFLDCSYNKLTTLEIDNNSLLKELVCEFNELSDLNIGSLSKLEHLNFGTNQLTMLNLSNATALKRLKCFNNTLEFLNVKNGNNSIISEFDSTNNPLLSCIQVDDADTANAGIAPYDNWEKDSLTVYSEDCGQTTLIPDINFEQYLVDSGIDSDGGVNGSVATSDISGLTSLNVLNKGISDLTGIQDFTSLTLLTCSFNMLTSLDLSQNTNLEELRCNTNQLSNLNISQCTNLTYLNYQGNQLTTLDISQNNLLTFLWGGGNPLSSLDLSQNTNLEVLNCDYNYLTNLDVSQNNLLTSIYVESNNLTSLDVSHLSKLNLLYCNDNQISNLDLSNVITLRSLECASNNLESLNVKTLITYLDATDNHLLTCIQVDDVDAANAYIAWYKDVTATYSEDCGYLGIDDVLAQTTKLYPNPVTNILTIDSEIPPIKVEIYSILGKKIKIFFSDFKSIPLDNLSNGVYIIQIFFDQGFTTKKLIKY